MPLVRFPEEGLGDRVGLLLKGLEIMGTSLSLLDEGSLFRSSFFGAFRVRPGTFIFGAGLRALLGWLLRLYKGLLFDPAEGGYFSPFGTCFRSDLVLRLSEILA